MRPKWFLLNRVATALEIGESQGKSGKFKRVEMIREKSLNSDRFSERKSFSTPQVQPDSSFCQNPTSRSHGKFSEVMEKSGESQGK